MIKIKILLVDDQVLFVERLKTVLEKSSDEFEVVGIAHNGEDAIKAVSDLNPDVILLDVRMPVMDGVETTRILHKRYPGLQIIMLTTFDDDDYVKKALELGAVGYLLKNIPPMVLISSIKAIRGGSVLLDPSIMAKLLKPTYQDHSSEPEMSFPQSVLERINLLSNREKEILTPIAQGLGNRQII